MATEEWGKKSKQMEELLEEIRTLAGLDWSILTSER